MTCQRVFASVLACAFLLLAGCATTTPIDGRPAQRPRIQPPPQPPDSLRLIIYRPQALVGAWGRPVVLINGRKMLTVLGESMLDPGSAFVVDVPAAHAQVKWIQSRKTEPDVDALVFNGPPGETRYLRWTLKPTYGYLEQVADAVAHEELAPLLYMGYRNMVDAK